jgi:hypothetical protein
LFDGNVLDAIDLVGVSEEEIGAEFAFLEAVVGEGLIPEELTHLSDFFLQSHLAEEGVDFAIDGGRIGTGGRRKRSLLTN